MTDQSSLFPIGRRPLLKLSAATAVALGAASPMLIAEPTAAQTAPNATGISITRLGAKPTAFGPAENFAGRVRIESLFQADAPARVGGGVITFDPGARTVWHSHPLGQTLIVTAGVGWVQEEGGPVQEMRPGDIVWIRPGVKHWHGASAEFGMTHVAIAEALDGNATTWMEPVTDAQYRR